MSKHTPGPWRSHGELINSNKREISIVLDYKSNTSTGANARLIAAAPELLEALERIVSVNGCTGGAKALVKEFKYIAKQAVAKAKGEGSEL